MASYRSAEGCWAGVAKIVKTNCLPLLLLPPAAPIARHTHMFNRIVSDIEVLRGKPRIGGTRISVEFILELVASGASRQEISMAYPHLTAEEVEEALLYAAQSLSNDTFRIALRLRREVGPVLAVDRREH